MANEGKEKERDAAKIEELRKEVEKDTAGFYKHYQEIKDELWKTREQLRSAESILSEVIDCGTADLQCIYDMEEKHPGTIDRAVDLKEELGSINFGNFVMAVKDKALEEVEDEDEISEQDKESFQDAIIDDNYVAWGGIAAYGYYQGGDKEANERRQELFSDFVNGNLSKEEFLKQYNEAKPAEEEQEQLPESSGE
ncbi:MAG: hypothetical protein M1503_03100 [Thaumarchaeota archaeon]|nr:hypothetical protein [Nitrososphaerota archaeon]MCL5317239.1 hypothetical protein [Nitrososphaerota archaeon]